MSHLACRVLRPARLQSELFLGARFASLLSRAVCLRTVSILLSFPATLTAPFATGFHALPSPPPLQAVLEDRHDVTAAMQHDHDPVAQAVAEAAGAAVAAVTGGGGGGGMADSRLP